MPDTLLSPLPPATNDQRRRWADMLWNVIGSVEKESAGYWTGQKLRLVVSEIEPPLKPNGDNQ